MSRGNQAELAFLEAWKKPPSASQAPKLPAFTGPLRGDQQSAHGRAQAAQEQPHRYSIRLDTPGGYTHAPDMLSVHNMEKRLFLPHREISTKPKDYDYDAEIRAVRAQRLRERQAARKKPSFASPFALEDDEEQADRDDQEAIRGLVSMDLNVDPDEPTEAQKYAATIALTPAQKQSADVNADEADTFSEEGGVSKPFNNAADAMVDTTEGTTKTKNDTTASPPLDQNTGRAGASEAELIPLPDDDHDGVGNDRASKSGPESGETASATREPKRATARFDEAAPQVHEYLTPEAEASVGEDDITDQRSLGSKSYAPSSAAPSTASARSTSSMQSVMSLSEKMAANLKDEDGNAMRAALKSEIRRGAVAPGIVPRKQLPSNSDQSMSQVPWKSKYEYATHPKFERPSQVELARGFTRFEEQSGKGAVPSLGELNGPMYSDTATLRSRGIAPLAEDDEQFDRRSFAPSTKITDKMSLAQLRPKDLFTPDPRPFRPLRYVRRSDPRQLLLCCAGACLSATQAASMQAAQSAHEAGIDALTPELQRQMEHSVKQIELGYANSEPKAGIGMVYCPTVDPWPAMAEAGDTSSLWSASTAGSKSVFTARGTPGRVEENVSRRLERPSEYARTTLQRAQLRAVIAALEYQSWETEGFNQLVIAVSQPWIVRGISEEIFAWRGNGFQLTGVDPEVFNVLGMAQEAVPDQDLWLLLDHLVKKLEEVDCTVRFWYLPPDSCKEMRLASQLALQGALKTKQQPMTVKWKRKDTGRKYFQLDEEALAQLRQAARGDDAASLASGASQMSAQTIRKMHKAENGLSAGQILAREKKEKEMNAHIPELRNVVRPPASSRPEGEAEEDAVPSSSSWDHRPVPAPPLPEASAQDADSVLDTLQPSAQNGNSLLDARDDDEGPSRHVAQETPSAEQPVQPSAQDPPSLLDAQDGGEGPPHHVAQEASDGEQARSMPAEREQEQQ